MDVALRFHLSLFRARAQSRMETHTAASRLEVVRAKALGVTVWQMEGEREGVRDIATQPQVFFLFHGRSELCLFTQECVWENTLLWFVYVGVSFFVMHTCSITAGAAEIYMHEVRTSWTNVG